MKQDSSWRKILDALLPEFLAFYFPEIHRHVDFSKDVTFLDKELQKILPKNTDAGKRVVDKLVRVWLLDGSEKWLLIHIEIQGYYDAFFAKRVYHCNYRISDKFDKEVISLALLTDDDPSWNESVFDISRWGFRLHFEFPVVKLLNYRDKWPELEKNPNPFAIVTKAFLKTVETQGKDHERYRWKKQFLLELYRCGLTRETIWELYTFIDVVMALPEIRNDELHEEVTQTVEEKKMPIITTAERIGMRKGLERGIKHAISDILEIKFRIEGLKLAKRIESINNTQKLQLLREGCKQARTIDEASELIGRAIEEAVIQ